MVNNSTNINKTNNHLSPKESLEKEGQQFHQYQQNGQSHLKSENIKKRPWHKTLDIHVLDWDRPKKVADLNRLMGSQSFPLDNWISNVKTYM
jgi:ATP-dependent exoDNAse (exonuclease V) alpha subunit